MAVSRRLRFEVLRRDGHVCRYCGGKAPDVRITVDHVVPVSLGGADEASNLVAACQDCNAGKASIGPDAALVADVADDNARWQAALATARKQLDGPVDDLLTVDLDRFDEEWRTWSYQDGREVYRPSNWRHSVAAFLNSGVTMEMVIDLVPVAMAPGIRESWSYLCGCVWRRVSEVQELAVSIMAELTEQDEIAADVRLRETRETEPHLEVELSIGEIMRRAAIETEQ